MSIQKKFVEVEKFSFIQKQQSYSLGVISSELTCSQQMLASESSKIIYNFPTQPITIAAPAARGTSR